jgi:nicotinic acid mononucleotide adenylyltransferase
MVELIPLIHWIDDNQSDISSTLIRQQVRAHASLDGLTYPDIESYIRTHNLYA